MLEQYSEVLRSSSNLRALMFQVVDKTASGKISDVLSDRLKKLEKLYGRDIPHLSPQEKSKEIAAFQQLASSPFSDYQTFHDWFQKRADRFQVLLERSEQLPLSQKQILFSFLLQHFMQEAYGANRQLERALFAGVLEYFGPCCINKGES